MKCLTKAAAIFVAATTAWSLTTADAKETTVGRWTLMSDIGSDGSPYCTIRVGAEDNGFSMQVTGSGSLVLAVANPAWKYAQNQRVLTKYAIDESPTWEGDAIAVAPGVLVNILQSSSEVIDRVTAAKSISLNVAGGSETAYDMRGAKEAGDALRACMAEFPPRK